MYLRYRYVLSNIIEITWAFISLNKRYSICFSEYRICPASLLTKDEELGFVAVSDSLPGNGILDTKDTQYKEPSVNGICTHQGTSEFIKCTATSPDTSSASSQVSDSSIPSSLPVTAGSVLSSLTDSADTSVTSTSLPECENKLLSDVTATRNNSTAVSSPGQVQCARSDIVENRDQVVHTGDCPITVTQQSNSTVTNQPVSWHTNQRRHRIISEMTVEEVDARLLQDKHFLDSQFCSKYEPKEVLGR